MIRTWIIISTVLLMAGCDSVIKPDEPPRTLPQTDKRPTKPVETKTVSLAEEVEALLAQRFIDPITDFIEKRADTPGARKYVAQMRLEREKRCGQIARRFSAEPKDTKTLVKLKAGYNRSCPQVVEEFAQQVKQATPAVAETPAEQPGDDEAVTEPTEAEPKISATELEECRVLFAIKRYVEAATACTPPAEQGSAEAQYRLGIIWRRINSYDKAVQWIQKAVAQDFAKAQYVLGQFYYHGQGVARDRRQAADWFAQAARQGLPEAQVQLAALYRSGDGVAKNPVEAVKWLRQAADQGEADAQLALGEMYQDGEGVGKNYADALKWLRKAARQRHPGAQQALGLLYGDNDNPAADNVEAYAWLDLAAAQGRAGSSAQRDTIAARLTTEQLEAARQLSRRLQEQYPQRHD